MLTSTLLLSFALAPQTSWYVDATAPGPGTGTLADPYSRVDFAAAQPMTRTGDTLIIGPGVYAGESIALTSKVIFFTAATDASQTVLEGAGQGSILALTGLNGPRAIVEGITFRGGRGTPDATTGSTYGGAVYAESGRVALRDCVFTDCRADYGGVVAARPVGGGLLDTVLIEGSSTDALCSANVDGGVLYVEGWARVNDSQLTGVAVTGRGGVAHVAGGRFDALNSVLEGHAALEGGAAYVLDRGIQLDGCSLSGTSGGNGGAVCAEGSTIDFEDTTIRGMSLGGGFGGGVYASDSSFNSLTRCRFLDCTAHSGGAIYSEIFGSLPTLECEFRDCSAVGSAQTPGLGGAVYSETTMYCNRTLFVRNSANTQNGSAGGAFYGIGRFEECTFADNQASALGATMVNAPLAPQVGVARSFNCIMAGSLSGGVPHVEGFAPISRSVVEGGAPGPEIIDADPRFWGNDDFHLLPDSPARKRPNVNSVRAGALRFDPNWCGQNCDGPIGVESCTAVINSTGVPASLAGLGSMNPQIDRLVLNATNLPVGSVGVLIAGRTAGFSPMAGGQGSLCLGGAILRFPGAHEARGNGLISLRPVLSHFPGGISVQAGDAWFFQVWYRDTNGGVPTSNFTPALFVRY